MSNAVNGNLSGPVLIVGATDGNLSAAADAISANVKSRIGEQCVAGALAGISLGGPTDWLGSNTYTRNLQTGVREDFNNGYISPPCLALDYPGFWRFRWTVTAGTHTVQVYVMQPYNQTPYPSLIVKANPAIGVNSDVTGTSPGGSGWTVIGPVSVSPTSEGVLWVQLWNNMPAFGQAASGEPNCTAFFSQITVT
jgi:hypothetical protein